MEAVSWEAAASTLFRERQMTHSVRQVRRLSLCLLRGSEGILHSDGLLLASEWRALARREDCLAETGSYFSTGGVGGILSPAWSTVSLNSKALRISVKLSTYLSFPAPMPPDGFVF